LAYGSGFGIRLWLWHTAIALLTQLREKIVKVLGLYRFTDSLCLLTFIRISDRLLKALL